MTIIEKVLALQEVELFSRVSTEALAHLASIAHEETLEPGRDLFREGDAADALHLVLTGAIRIHRAGRDVTQAGAGDVLGTWALLDVETRVATATVTEAARLLRIDRYEFYDLIADHLEITQGVFSALVKRVRRLIEPLHQEPGPETT
jgi:CRP/FNR family cyclic AMP-dependent transcriptional regulator